jgi:hypothetical protein
MIEARLELPLHGYAAKQLFLKRYNLPVCMKYKGHYAEPFGIIPRTGILCGTVPLKT